MTGFWGSLFMLAIIAIGFFYMLSLYSKDEK